MTTRSKNPNDGRVWGWIKKLQKGDVIRSRSGALRVVRAVDHFGPGICRTVVHLAIKRCSWTHRAYTVYNGNDLRQMGYRMVKANFELSSEIDRLMEREFSRPSGEKCVLTCCDGLALP